MDKVTARRLNRIRKSQLNATVGLVTSIIMGVASFVERMVFNQFFIPDYLGLYSFFNNLIGILSAAELGLSTAIAFVLYKPLEYRDEEQIAAVMQFFRKAYFVVGTFIFVIGTLIIPAFPYLLKTDIDLTSCILYYLIFLAKTVCNYYFGYKEILIGANQDGYILNFATNISWTGLYIVEMIISVKTQDFLLYTIAIFVFNLIRIAFLNTVANRRFRFIKKYRKTKIDRSIKEILFRNTKGLIITRLASVLVTTTDSVLISAMVGTAFLGIYSNYQMIITGLLSLTFILPRAVTASLGNAGVTESLRDISKSFYTLNLGFFLIYAPVSIILVNIINPIIGVFFGEDKVLPMFSAILICISFYLSNQRELLLSFKSSLGLYWEDRIRPLIEGVTNLVVSIILGYFLGFDGIIIGTIISQICVNLPIEPQVVMHSGLRTSSFWYYITIIGRFIFTAVVSAITLYINSFISLGGIIGIIVKAIIAILVSCFLFYIIFRNNEDARTVMRVIRTSRSH